MNALALACATLATVSFAQTTPTTTTTTYPAPATSVADNPGVLGHNYADFHYSWVDFNENNASPRGFIAGLNGNTPVSRGMDFSLGYDYFRENNHRNPFNNSPYDVRSHQATAALTLFSPNAGIKPFFTGAVGYKWTHGDLQSFRTYDNQWVWSAGAGAEIPLGAFTVTPRIAYSDDFRGSVYSAATWHYGAEANHWFSETLGGYLDVAYHDPRGRYAAEYWTYTAGVRMRF